MRHADEDVPEHVAQLASQAVQRPAPSTTSEKVLDGHSATQVPAWRKGVAAEVHERQSELVGPSHVPHAASHASQTDEPLRNLPTGVHDARQLPGGSKKGVADAQVRHCVPVGPAHVAQLPWQATHTSAVLPVPPTHVKPSSIAMQSALHPSLSIVLPSSQTSSPTRNPSPHTAAQLSGWSMVPPWQTKPVSIWHVGLQPSLASVLLSSHCSSDSHRTRRPSPHLGAHESTPPTPDPSVLDEVHSKPSSMRQSASQPSPPTVLLSSQPSAVERMPLPQTWTGGT